MRARSGLPLALASMLMFAGGLFCTINGMLTVLAVPCFASDELAAFAKDMVRTTSDLSDPQLIIVVVGVTCAIMGFLQIWAGLAGFLASSRTARPHHVATTLGVIGCSMAVFAFIAVATLGFSPGLSAVTIIISLLPFLYTAAVIRVAPKSM